MMERLTFFSALAILAVMFYAGYDMLTSDKDQSAAELAQAVREQHNDQAVPKGCDVVYKFNESGYSTGRSLDCKKANQKK